MICIYWQFIMVLRKSILTIRPIICCNRSRCPYASWLHHQPLVHYFKEAQLILCHAGVYPTWSLNTLLDASAMAHTHLQNETKAQHLFQHMYQNEPAHWHQALTEDEQIRFTLNALTRMRYVHEDGGLG